LNPVLAGIPLAIARYPFAVKSSRKFSPLNSSAFKALPMGPIGGSILDGLVLLPGRSSSSIATSDQRTSASGLPCQYIGSLRSYFAGVTSRYQGYQFGTGSNTERAGTLGYRYANSQRNLIINSAAFIFKKPTIQGTLSVSVSAYTKLDNSLRKHDGNRTTCALHFVRW
jgi:hypothetical protein